MKNIYSSFFTVMLVSMFCVQGYSQCLDQPHTPYYEDGWLSCQMQDNPNEIRPVSHWIMYDLGWEYTLDSSYIWNYNSWGINDRGMKDVIIDYSLDGQNWMLLDTFEFEMASGSVKYEGFEGPDFGGVAARYVLLTALNNWGNEPCTGLSELKIYIGEPTTSVDPELEINTVGITVVPNPVQNKAEISILSEAIPERVALYDISGKVLQTKSNLNSKNVTMDLSGLPGGVYFVKAWVDDGLASTKLVKVNN